ncbi:MAG: peptidase M16 [Alphaproteobacteria bacterium]|nr:peptidase M16 [Alphaproteobacteria bacterium]
MAKADTTRITVLENGFTIVTDSVPHVETMSAGVYVGVGAKNEVPENNGISHFLEHLMFKGTKTRTARGMIEELEADGLGVNAYTSKEITTYHLTGLKESLGKSIEVLADMVQRSQFPQNELDSEREVVKQEIARSRDNPTRQMFDQLLRQAYPDQPYGRTVLGPEANINALPRQAFFDYVKENYTAENMVLAVSGNVDHDEVVALAKKHFDELPQGKPAPAKVPEYVGGYEKTEGPIEQAHFAIGMKSVGRNHPDYYAHILAAQILGGGMSSRLFEEVREKRGLVYTTSASYTGNDESGMIYTYGGTKETQLAEMVPVMTREITRLSEDATQAELDKVRKRLMTSLAGAQEAMEDRRESVGKDVLREGRVVPMDELKAKLDAVTVEDIKRVAADWRRNAPTVSGYGKVSKMPGYDEIKGMLPPPSPPAMRADRMYSLAGIRPDAAQDDIDISSLIKRQLKPANRDGQHAPRKKFGMG